MSVQRFKIVLLGEGRVGKTSILLRYINGEYNDKQVSTLQASYLDKRIVVNGDSAQLSVWDTAGQERFHALGPIYYRDADAALLVYDITDTGTAVNSQPVPSPPIFRQIFIFQTYKLISIQSLPLSLCVTILLLHRIIQQSTEMGQRTS